MNCFFCQRNIKEIDYKETDLIERFTSGLGKIKGKTKTKLCTTHQRKLGKAIKRARHLGLLPFTK
ncbi:MAG: 30S ribosomal protein S18 [Candidatus Pacebacteria bacterium]|nr:30S ribosomal protein S18 [Candidatus Paceibacterota bacterium]